MQDRTLHVKGTNTLVMTSSAWNDDNSDRFMKYNTETIARNSRRTSRIIRELRSELRLCMADSVSVAVKKYDRTNNDNNIIYIYIYMYIYI